MRQLALVAALTSAVMVYYVARSVDDYKYTYVGRFFGSVVLIGWAVVAMRKPRSRGPLARGLMLTTAAVVGAWMAYTGRFNNGYHGSPESAWSLAARIAADPRWDDAAPAITIHENGWIEAASLVLQLERRGRACGSSNAAGTSSSRSDSSPTGAR